MPFDPSTSSSQSSRLSQMSCFKSRQVKRQTFVVDLFSILGYQMRKETFAICKPDVFHCRRRCFLTLTNIEPSSHVDDDSSSPQSMFDSIGQCESFCHQCTATNSSDSRRTPTQTVNKHLLNVQRITRCHCCDTSLL